MKAVAGHALDLLVAEKVMGWKVYTHEEMEAKAKEVWKEQPQCRYFGHMGFSAWPTSDGSVTCIVECPSYSTEIEQAWKVYLRIGWLMRLEDYGAFGWACEFLAGQPDQEDVVAKAGTAPLAICIAALLVAEQKEKIHG